MGVFDCEHTRAEEEALAEARAELARAIEKPCSEGCCTEFIDPETGENIGGWGPVDCACQDEA